MLNRTTSELPPTSGRWRNGPQGDGFGEPGFVERRSPDQLRLDLHDRLGPGLVNLEMRLASLEESVGATGVPAAQVASLRLAVAQLIEELRRIVHCEPPERLERNGLVAAVRTAATLAARPGLEVRFSCSGAPFEPPALVAAVIYRAALEGITNVVRHSHASNCWVLLRIASEAVTLKVRDNGVGPRARDTYLDGRHGGLGLASLRISAHSLGGEAQLLRRREGGASLIVTLPLRAPLQTRRFRRHTSKVAAR